MILKVNGKDIKLDLRTKSRANASDLHKNALKLIREAYPYDPIVEEVYIPDVGLYIDIFLPNRLMAFEAQGEQHFTHKSYFHKDRMEFLKAQHRDRLKKQVLEDNGITLIELKFDEEQEWKNQILQRK